MIEFLIIWAFTYASLSLGVEFYWLIKKIIQNWHAND